MSRRKPQFVPEPRTFNEFQVAARLNRGLEWFRQNRVALTSEGFPKYDALLGGWDSDAIDRWMDARSGIGLPSNDAEAKALKALHGKRSA